MIAYHFRISVAASLFLLLSLPALSQKKWELVKNKDSIFIYKRDLAGSSLKELKIVSKFHSTLTGFVAFITDISAQPSYIYSCTASKVVKETSDKEVVFYQQIKLPWPVTDRDGIFRQVIEQDSITRVVSIHSDCLSTLLPKNKDFVRVPQMKSSWKISTNGDGTLNTEYQIFCDPGGSVPLWLVNLFLTEAPYKTQMNMRKLVNQDKYQKAILHFIRN